MEAVGQANPAPRARTLSSGEAVRLGHRCCLVHAKYHATEEWLDRDRNEFSPEQNYYVGGNTNLYGAALFRLPLEGFGVIPPRRDLSRLATSYDDFERISLAETTSATTTWP